MESTKRKKKRSSSCGKYTQLLLSHKKEGVWVSSDEVDELREPIIQSEMSQKEKDKYRILTHIYRIQKNGSEEFIYWAAMEKQT